MILEPCDRSGPVTSPVGNASNLSPQTTAECPVSYHDYLVHWQRSNYFRLDYRTGLIWAFAAPVCLVIGVNSFMFLKAMLIARKTMRNRKNLSMDETKRTLTLIKGEAGWMTLRISKCCASYSGKKNKFGHFLVVVQLIHRLTSAVQQWLACSFFSLLDHLPLQAPFPCSASWGWRGCSALRISSPTWSGCRYPSRCWTPSKVCNVDLWVNIRCRYVHTRGDFGKGIKVI